MLFAIYGTDEYRCRQHRDKLIEEFRRKRDQSGFNVSEFDLAVTPAAAIVADMLTVPLLGDRRLIVLRGSLDDPGAAQTIRAALERQPDMSNALLCLDVATKPIAISAKATPLLAYITQQTYAWPHVWEYNELSPREAEQWLARYAAEHTIIVEPSALSALVAALGPDLRHLTLELEKLAAYANPQSIRPIDVATLVQTTPDDIIFDLLDAVSERQTQRAHLLLERQLQAGVYPLILINSLFRQITLLIKIISRGGGNSATLARELGVHPYAVQKALRASRNFNLAELITIADALATLEEQVKTGSTVTDALLHQHIAQFCAK